MQQAAPVDNEDNILTRADSVRRADLPLLVDGVLTMRKVQIIPRLRIMSRPCCDACHSEMWLVSIEPDDKPDHDRRAFECPRCQYERVEVVKYR